MIAFFFAGFRDCAVLVSGSGNFGVSGVPVASAGRSFFGTLGFHLFLAGFARGSGTFGAVVVVVVAVFVVVVVVVYSVFVVLVVVVLLKTPTKCRAELP